MDFGVISESTSSEVKILIQKIYRNTEISPKAKIDLIGKVLAGTGFAFKKKVFNDVSLAVGSPIRYSSKIDTKITQNLAKYLVRNYALNRENDLSRIKAFFDLNVKDAQGEAFNNGKSMQNHPTLIRKTAGRPDCDWCKRLIARGSIVNPQPEDFARHENCDCIIEVHGYNTRNGRVNNYRRKK